MESLKDIVTLRGMKFACRIIRLKDSRHSKTAMFWEAEGKHKRGRPKNTWSRTFKEDLGDATQAKPSQVFQVMQMTDNV